MKPFKAIQRFFNSSFFTYGLFWSWNLLFAILFIWLELSTHFIFHIIRDTFQGTIPLDLALFGLFSLALPIVCIILGFTKFRSDQHKLIHLFYGVEGPLLLFCLLRITVLRELTGGTAHLLLIALIGGVFYFYGLISEKKEDSKRWQAVKSIAHACMLFISFLIAAILSFYAIPMIWGFFSSIGEIFHEISLERILMIGILGTIFILFTFYTATLFVFTPVVLPFLYGKAFQKSFTESKRILGKSTAISILVLTIGFNLALFITLNWNQPQNEAFELLAEAEDTIEGQKQLLEEKELIREGLVNAYLAKYRYISGVENNNHIEEMYKQGVGVSDDVAEALQSLYNVFTKPFLYDGNMRKDRLKAMKDYESFFDRPMDKFEKESIRSAIEATWDRDGIEASLLSINEEKVLLKSQSITVKENAQFAKIELHEVYQNQTFDREEIFYYFSLPESAVVTGLWLSDDDSTQKKFSYRVSPRGAAQEVYKKEVQRRVDPSLLEQVGPRQYRLRAFPILPKSRIYNQRNRGDIMPGANFHLWLEYKLPLSGNQLYLPTLLERRIVYWDKTTEFTINGKESQKQLSDWYPKSIRLEKEHQFKTVYTQLQDSTAVKASAFELPPNNLRLENIAVVVDQSYSMMDRKEEVKTSLNELRSNFKSSAIDVFTVQGEVEKMRLEDYQERLQQEDSRFYHCFGNQDNLTVLNKVNSKLKRENYEFVLILTDEGSYELISDSIPAYAYHNPVYFLHLGGRLPAVYSDAEIETIEKNKGKSLVSIQELVEHQLFTKLQQKDSALIDFVDGLLFEEVERIEVPQIKEFTAISARQYLKKQSESLQGNKRLSIMDKIHSIAQSIGFVSPYSSMIVLVNDRQQQALNEAEAREDRFDREVENGAANLSVPGNPFQVSGTPEPEEWMLIGIIAAMILFSLLKGRLF